MLLFIHGGWWRSLDKSDHSFVAPPFTAAGAVVVVPNYALCPTVSMEEIALQMARSLVWCWHHAHDLGADPGRISVAYQDFVTPVTGVILLDAAMQGEWDAFRNALSHLILPSALLGLFSLAYISRMTRSFMITELQQQYVIAARVKGMSEARVIWRHALRNAMVPLLTVIALSYASLLEGSVLTETIFAWPGLGRYITNSLLNADMNAVLGGTLVVGAVFIGINLLSDILGRLVDPRTR